MKTISKLAGILVFAAAFGFSAASNATVIFTLTDNGSPGNSALTGTFELVAMPASGFDKYDVLNWDLFFDKVNNDSGDVADSTFSSLIGPANLADWGNYGPTTTNIDFPGVSVWWDDGASAGNFSIASDYSGTFAFTTAPGGQVPEPGTLALFGLGLAGIGYRRHRSKKAA